MFEGLLNIKFPQMVRIKQKFPSEYVANVNQEVMLALAKPEIAARIQPGKRIAVLVGSRGIADIDCIITALVSKLKSLGAAPFIVPAMGSHGGATAAGQLEVLESLGITEEKVGAPIISSMETVEVGTLASGIPVYFDKNAFYADGIIPVGRVKPHTAFRACRESGLVKMIAIGGGKQRGAEALHSNFNVATFDQILLAVYHYVRQKANILFGVAIVENAYEQIAHIEAIPAECIEQREPELLKKAWQFMPRILFDHFDVLIVEQMGKNISGDGMDPNITGRYATSLTGGPSYQRLAVLGLTPESHGNALGVGMADVTTRRLVSEIDYAKGYMNAFTSKIVFDFVKVPMTMENDKAAIAVAIKSCSRIAAGEEKVVRIKTTLDLSEIQISTALLPQAANQDNIEILGAASPMRFDDAGTLL
jgi:hypothetical protein